MSRPLRAISKDTRERYKPVFSKEISNIMHAAGDCPTPLQEAVIAMEIVIKHELWAIIESALHVSDKIFNSTNLEINHSNIVFVLRNNPQKLSRILKYLKDFDSFKRLEKTLSGKSTPNVNFKDDLSHFISEAQDMYNISESHNDICQRKLKRADQMSRYKCPYWQ